MELLSYRFPRKLSVSRGYCHDISKLLARIIVTIGTKDRGNRLEGWTSDRGKADGRPLPLTAAGGNTQGGWHKKDKEWKPDLEESRPHLEMETKKVEPGRTTLAEN